MNEVERWRGVLERCSVAPSVQQAGDALLAALEARDRRLAELAAGMSTIRECENLCPSCYLLTAGQGSGCERCGGALEDTAAERDRAHATLREIAEGWSLNAARRLARERLANP